MAFEQTWRWFGPNDPISLKEIRQTGATGVVTALHQIPVGEVWSRDEIEKRRDMILAAGLTWSVVESLPVHENIKKQKDNYKELIGNYKTSIKNLAACGIDTICYNFMPVLDWSRTKLNVEFRDGAITTKFDADIFAAFDLYILERQDAEKSYTSDQILAAKKCFESMSQSERDQLLQTVLLGLPGSLETYTPEAFRKALNEYVEISKDDLRKNLYYFLKEIIPTAEEAGVYMTIHPDDPPWSLLGLPRIVGTAEDLQGIIDAVDSPSNGLTFCTGSLGAGYNNDLVNMAKKFAHRINFVHLRNLTRNEDGDFMEAYHLEGDIDLYNVMNALLMEQRKRTADGRKDFRMPMRPDHGHLMIPELDKKGIYPGYSLFGRMRGLSELRGLELGILRSLDDN